MNPYQKTAENLAYISHNLTALNLQLTRGESAGKNTDFSIHMAFLKQNMEYLIRTFVDARYDEFTPYDGDFKTYVNNIYEYEVQGGRFVPEQAGPTMVRNITTMQLHVNDLLDHCYLLMELDKETEENSYIIPGFNLNEYILTDDIIKDLYKLILCYYKTIKDFADDEYGK
nr:MAG TPA: hypothetical protein [Caudoviricetes sp.]